MKKIELVSVALVALMALTVVSGAGVLKVQGFPTIPLGAALDNTALTWTTGGDAVWYGETTTTHDNVDAAQSGDIGDSQSMWLSTTVTGPGTLTFWWKVSSEQGFDYLRFYVNEVQQRPSISGEQDWVQVTILIATEGPVTLKWAYTKDIIISDGVDAGWVDQVTFTPGNVKLPKVDKVLQYNLTTWVYDPTTDTYVEVTIGKVTVDSKTGRVVVNANFGRMGEGHKEYYKEWFRESPMDIGVELFNRDLGQSVDLGGFAATNNGGNIHGEGTITNAATLQTLALWLTSDDVFVGLYIA